MTEIVQQPTTNRCVWDSTLGFAPCVAGVKVADMLGLWGRAILTSASCVL